jgi:hypothetical protein
VPERIVLKKPTENGGETHSTLESTQTEWLDIGGEEGSKYLIGVVIRRKIKEALTAHYFVKKFPENSRMNLNSLKELCRVYVVLARKGYPVPQTARYIKNENRLRLVLSDMTEGGAYWVWGINTNPTAEEQRTLLAMNLTQSDVDSIKAQSYALADRAEADKVWLAFHSYHLRKHKTTGKVEVILLDLDRLALRQDMKTLRNGSKGVAFEFFHRFLGELNYLGGTPPRDDSWERAKRLARRFLAKVF